MKRINIRTLVISSIFSALVFITTSLTMIRTPFAIFKEAYFHAGDSIIFLSAWLLGCPYAIFIASIGSLFADLYLGSPHYMIATFFIKGIMGAIAGIFLYNNNSNKSKTNLSKTILGLSLSVIWMALSYYGYEVFVLGINYLANLPNLFVNFAQGIVGVIIYLPLSKIIEKTNIRNRIYY